MKYATHLFEGVELLVGSVRLHGGCLHQPVVKVGICWLAVLWCLHLNSSLCEIIASELIACSYIK